MKSLVSLFLLLSLASFSLQSNAKISVEIVDAEKKIAAIKVIDKILPDEEVDFIEELDKLQADGYKLKLNAVVLNSAGGNGSAAQRMGEYIRERRLNTYVPKNGNCASACVYTLIGGVVRMVYGRVAVHRTTYSAELPTEKLEKALRDADKRTVAHVEAMGISHLLADAILMTPNWATRELDYKDRRRWGVHGTDRVYEELWFRKTASETKLSLDEVRDIFDKNIVACTKKAERYEMTLWDCTRSKIKN